jgi:histidinol dehydrogenase
MSLAYTLFCIKYDGWNVRDIPNIKHASQIEKIEFETISSVEEIAKEVRFGGDAAVKKYTALYDKIELDDLLISRKEIKNAYKNVDKDTISAIKKSIKNDGL